MGIVVNKQKTIALILDFEAAARVLELAQRSRNFFKRNSKLGGEGNHTNSILDVVLPGNIQNRFAQLLPAPINAKDRSEIPQLDIGAAIIRLFEEPERDRSLVFCAQSRRVRIIDVVKNRFAGLLDKLRKNFFDRLEIDMKIEMLFLNI